MTVAAHHTMSTWDCTGRVNAQIRVSALAPARGARAGTRYGSWASPTVHAVTAAAQPLAARPPRTMPSDAPPSPYKRWATGTVNPPAQASDPPAIQQIRASETVRPSAPE